MGTLSRGGATMPLPRCVHLETNGLIISLTFLSIDGIIK
jgi:hypothetical protein